MNVKILKEHERPPQDAEIDLMVIAARALERAQEWYGGGERCLSFLADRMGYSIYVKGGEQETQIPTTS